MAFTPQLKKDLKEPEAVTGGFLEATAEDEWEDDSGEDWSDWENDDSDDEFEITEVPKGIRGADIVQIIKTRSGLACGTILWEVKNTRTWTQSWITKLKEDKRTLKSEIAIIVTKTLPKEIKSFDVNSQRISPFFT
jgi:hypothetical protein